MKKRLVCLSLIFAMTAAQVLPVSAARKDEVQAQKSATQSKLSAAQAQASSLESKKQALMGQISTTQQQIVDAMTQIELLADEIVDKEADIKETKEELVQAEADRDEQYEAMKKRIQYMYENGGSDTWAQILLESDSFATMLSKAENTEKMYQYDSDELKEMKAIVQEVKDLEEQLGDEQHDSETSESEQEGVKASLETKVAELKSTASDYETQIANAKAQAEQYKQLIQQQNAELKKIQQEEAAAAKAAEEAAKQQQNQNNGGSTGGSAITGGNSSSNNSVKPNNGGTSSNNNGGSVNNGGGSANNNSGNTGNSGSSSNAGSSNTTAPSKPSAPSYNSGTGAAVVAYAMQFIGNPYVYGGNSLTNGIDCSGFTQQIYGHFGYSLPRVSDAQASSGVGISYSEARAGDLIVYPGHVAILTGDGGIVHASNSAPYPKGGIKYTANALYKNYIAVRRIVQ